jgi:hypothetical protein
MPTYVIFVSPSYPSDSYSAVHNRKQFSIIFIQMTAWYTIKRKRYIQNTAPSIYNLLPAFLLFSFSLSRRNRLRIFPDGDFGISSINSTPPAIHL